MQRAVEKTAAPRAGRAAPPPRDPRASVALTCQLKIGSGPWRPASMINVSRSGFRIAWLPGGEIGRQIWVRIPGLEAMPATIRWRDLGGVGCEFTRPLNAAVVEHLSRKTARH